MAGEAGCVFAGDSFGQETPVGFQDSPGQWYTANHRKRAALSQLEGEPTQRESQATQVATEVATQPLEGLAPVFVAATPSQEEIHDEDEVDEEETQIRMTNSEDQDEAERKIFEEVVPLPIASTASGTGRSFGDAGMGNSEYDADSDMSDDMLEQDGSVAGLSSIAASFQQRVKEPEVVEKRVYKPRTPFRASPALSNRDDPDSSGDETEIEGEPKQESPMKSQATLEKKQTLFKDSLTPRLTKSASYSKSTAKGDSLAADTKSIRRSLSTPEKTQSPSLPRHSSKRDHSEVPKSSHARAKRSRRSEALEKSAQKQTDPESAADQAASSEKHHTLAKSDDDLQHDHSTAQRASLDKVTRDIQEEDANPSTGAELDKEDLPPLSRSTARSQDKASASTRGRKRAANSRSITDSTGAQTEQRSILYESDITKATHVIAPQLKRTVKLLCGISCCKHILGERWLDESARVGEDKWQFDLSSTMYGVSTEQRQRLLAGYSVFIINHKSVLPPAKDLVKIVECAGGKASSKGKPGTNDLVITSEAALAVATVRKQLASANPDRIYSPELILSSILQQRVERDKHRLELPVICKSWATKQQK
ncbi:BRCT domain [Phytophthora cactorum]|nr:BRCT domain [Phytophthora cactorum]